MADFQSHLPEFESRGVNVIAVSSETETEAQNTVEKRQLAFPVGFGLNPPSFASITGAFYEEDDEGDYLHATGFLLDPQGQVDIAVYSSGAIGRFTAADCLQILEYRLKED